MVCRFFRPYTPAIKSDKPAYPRPYICSAHVRPAGAGEGLPPLRTLELLAKGTDMAKRPYVQTARFELRCSPEELAGWHRAAESQDMTLARYIRMSLSRSDEKLSAFIRNYQELSRAKTDPALIRQLAAIGNNLNQIAFWCNAHKSRQEAEPVEKGIAGVRDSLEKLLSDGGNREVGP